MPSDRPKFHEIVLSANEHEHLEGFSRSRSLSHALVCRAKIVLMSAAGHTDTAIGKSLGVSEPTVRKWRNRFLAQGIAALYDEARPGRPRTYDDEQVAQAIYQALSTRLDDATHWSVRSFAQASVLSKSTAQRFFPLFGVQPHRRNGFKLSNDPFFVEKVRDMVGLYLNPPEKALVLCVDEKSQVQALERTQPVLPMGLGYVEGVAQNYVRHGTTTLYAALDVATGTVIGQCKPRHRHQEFLSFLRHIERNAPSEIDVHLIIDNFSAHKHPKVRVWFARRPRFHVHFTPTYASWINQVDGWFWLITQQAIRRGSFTAVKDLIRGIERYIEQYNQHACPFV